ncbi:hypothetical protein G6L30_17080 [Agrobacterium rhizogenes]|nr:hypothetical protein [Rhizobium rhizogenes]
MSYPASAYAGMVAIGLLSWAGGYNLGVIKGHAEEQEEIRQSVNDRMTSLGFCRWLEVSRISEDCVLQSKKQEVQK